MPKTVVSSPSKFKVDLHTQIPHAPTQKSTKNVGRNSLTELPVWKVCTPLSEDNRPIIIPLFLMEIVLLHAEDIWHNIDTCFSAWQSCLLQRGRTQIDSFTQNGHWTFSKYPNPLPPKQPIENQCNFSNDKKISYHCFAAYQLGLSDYEVVSNMLFMTRLNKIGQSKCSYTLTNYAASESCRIKFLAESSLKKY